MFSSVGFGTNSVAKGDYSFAGGVNATTNIQDDASVVLSCAPVGSSMFTSFGPQTIAFRAAGDIDTAGRRYTQPPVHPIEGNQILKGFVVQLAADSAPPSFKNYVAAIEYTRPQAGQQEPEKTGTWTYFPQNPAHWATIAPAVKLGPGSVAFALDTLAAAVATKPEATKQPEVEQKQEHKPDPVNVKKTEQPDYAKPRLQKYFTMRSAVSPVTAAAARLAPEMGGLNTRETHKQFYPIKVSIPASTLNQFTVTLLSVPSTIPFSMLRIVDGALKWHDASMVIHTPGTWIANKDNIEMICEPQLLSYTDAKYANKNYVNIGLLGRRIVMNGSIVTTTTTASVVISGYLEIVYII